MNYQVRCEDMEIPVRIASIFPSPYLRHTNMEYVQFAWRGKALLHIHSAIPVSQIQIRPAEKVASYKQITENEIEIYLLKPEKFSLEINGSTESNLLIFPEIRLGEYKPTSDQHIIYFKKGVHDVDILTIRQDDTLIYLEEDALVHGKISIENCQNIRVCGHGIITMSKYPYESRPKYARCIDVIGSKHIIIQDITIMDSNDWSLRVTGCENVLIDNIKIFGCRGNSDGVDICGSRHVIAQNIFTRVWDDSLVVKALDTGDVEDVVFRHCTLWNDFARPMEVGVELRADKVHHVKFEDICVLHMSTGYPIMGIHHGDHAVVSDIQFDNIRIEDAPGSQLLDLRIIPSFWNRDSMMGSICNVSFRNIYVGDKSGLTQLMSDSRIEGYDEEHCICGVDLENIWIGGKKVQSIEDLGIDRLIFAKQVTLKTSENSEKALKRIATRVSINKQFTYCEDGRYKGEFSIEFINKTDLSMSKQIWLRISPEHTGGRDPEPVLVIIPSNASCSVSFPRTLQPGKYMVSVQSKDPEVEFSWLFLELPWQLSESWSEYLTMTNYWGTPSYQIRARYELGRLILQSPVLQDQENRLIIFVSPTLVRSSGKVVFSSEETDYGRSPALLYKKGRLEAAPQLRCPLEITMVFHAQPEAKVRMMVITGGDSDCRVIDLTDLGISEMADDFWLEVQVCTKQTRLLRYPLSLFHSPSPNTSAHMYGHVILKNNRR